MLAQVTAAARGRCRPAAADLLWSMGGMLILAFVSQLFLPVWLCVCACARVLRSDLCSSRPQEDGPVALAFLWELSYLGSGADVGLVGLQTKNKSGRRKESRVLCVGTHTQ